MPSLLVYFGLCWFHPRAQYGIFFFPFLSSTFSSFLWADPAPESIRAQIFHNFCAYHITQRFSFTYYFFFLFPIQSSTFSSLEVSDLSRCYWATWLSLQTLAFLTTWNSSPLLCKKKKIFNPHSQGELQDKNIHTPKEVPPECVISLCHSFQFCVKHFLLLNRANTYIEQKTLYLLSI